MRVNMFITVFKMTRDSILSCAMPLNLDNGTAVHKWLTNQQNCTRQNGGLLYRVIKQKDDIYLYVQSKLIFNCTNCEDYGLECVKQFEVSDISNCTSFDVQCFPTFCKNDKFHLIKNRDKRREWLKNQFEKNGITILDSVEYAYPDCIIEKEKTVSISTVCFRGIMKITDREKANQFISNGLGKMKNYGVGLILVK